jgi:hypothetical protein
MVKAQEPGRKETGGCGEALVVVQAIRIKAVHSSYLMSPSQEVQQKQSLSVRVRL